MHGMTIERRPGETDFSFHKRLIYGKLEDKTLADVDYSELAELVYGQQYSSDVARRMMYGSKRTLDLLDEETMESETETACGDDLLLRTIELKKEQQKFYDQRAAFNKMIRERARQEELNEILTRAIQESDLPDLVYNPCSFQTMSGNNTLLVSLNDIHYGATFENAWCVYNSTICAEMMARYLERIIRIADLHQSDDCVVWAAGDMISGSIHRSIQITNKENVIQQIMGVSELIAQFLAGLSGQFRTVRFVSVAGNHSRIEPNKDDALTAERLDDLVEWYLSARLQNFDNIVIDETHKVDNTISLFSVRGKNYAMVHGDFDNSYSKVQSLCSMIREPVYAILSGHMHHNQTNVVQGVHTVMAGSFQGMDQFCVEKRIVGEPEQMVCVCDTSGIVCHYDVPLQE